MSGVELWGGIECTMNRVGDEYVDQLERCGHYARLDDLDRVAALGIRRLRYPALWERVAPRGLANADWRWCDDALGRLRHLGVEANGIDVPSLGDRPTLDQLPGRCQARCSSQVSWNQDGESHLTCQDACQAVA